MFEYRYLYLLVTTATLVVKILNLRNIVVYHINILRHYLVFIILLTGIYFSFSEYTYIIAL